MVQILYGTNVFDECGPWVDEASAVEWASSYVNSKKNGEIEPVLDEPEQSTIKADSFNYAEGEN